MFRCFLILREKTSTKVNPALIFYNGVRRLVGVILVILFRFYTSKMSNVTSNGIRGV